MIKEYQINVAGKTKNEADLPSGFIISVRAISKEGIRYILTLDTCVAAGKPKVETWDKIPNGRITYAYDASADNGKSENLMLTNNLESDLDTWVGSGNWAIV